MLNTPSSWWRHRRVLVIGGEGFLAQNTLRQLLAWNAQVTVLVREQRRAPLEGVARQCQGDIREMVVARDVVAGQEVVLNFAGVTSAVTSNEMPSVALLVECLPHLTLLDACAELASPPLVVFPSSRLVYGRPQGLPVTERHPTDPLTVYGVHKLAVEHYLRVYQRTRGVPFLVFRISNPYGPHQHAQRGYGILNAFIQRALAGQPLRLFGDGAQLRDFIHVADLVDIMLRAVATPACHNDIYNVGGPEPVSLRSAAEKIAELAGGVPLNFEPWPADYLKVETGDYLGSMDKLARHLSLPHFMPLADGIQQVVQAYSDRQAAADAVEPWISPPAPPRVSSPPTRRVA